MQHLHLDDYPTTLGLLASVIRGRTIDGYEPTEHGANVDFDALARSYLSSTETAVVHIARGVAVLEYAGGPPPALATEVVAAVSNVCGDQN